MTGQYLLDAVIWIVVLAAAGKAINMTARFVNRRRKS